MNSLQAINRKARKLEQAHIAEVSAQEGDVEALQQGKQKAKPGRVYYPLGCTISFNPGWEVDVSGGTAGLCQPVERDLFDCYLGCAWPAQVPDHVSNNPDWTSKCGAAVNDWRNVDVVYP
ncbi:MAG: quinohemoprotein amine dehydrogenase subunit gamma [Bryobacteraceae bacterium]